jgi:hypothetical protein
MVSLKQISMCIVLWIRTEKLSRSQIFSPYPSLQLLVIASVSLCDAESGVVGNLGFRRIRVDLNLLQKGVQCFLTFLFFIFFFFQDSVDLENEDCPADTSPEFDENVCDEFLQALVDCGGV